MKSTAHAFFYYFMHQQGETTELNFFIIMLDHNVKKGLSIDRNIFGYRGNLKNLGPARHFLI